MKGTKQLPNQGCLIFLARYNTGVSSSEVKMKIT